jgi:hypothetical protein
MPKGAMKAVYYREWRMNRALYLLVGLLTILPSAPVLWSPLTLPHRFIRELLTEFVVSNAHGTGGASVTLGILLAGALGLGVFWNDRRQDGLEAALEGPLSRRALMAGKLFTGFQVIIAAQGLLFLLWMVIAVSVGKGHLIGSLASGAILTLMASGCVFTLTLAWSAVMGSPFFVALTTTLWLLIPRVVATMVVNLTYAARRMTIPEAAAMNATVTHIRWFSPLTGFYPANGQALLYAGYFALWAIFGAWAAFSWWDRVPFERLHAPLCFPGLWNAVYALLALVSGFVLANVARSWGFGGGTAPELYACTLVLAALLWWLWRWILIRVGWSRDSA